MILNSLDIPLINIEEKKVFHGLSSSQIKTFGC